jgi:hypothetical protein
VTEASSTETSSVKSSSTQTSSAKARRAESLLDSAAASGLRLAALGGVAVQLLCPSARPDGPWSRELADIDVATTLKNKPAADKLILEHGFAPDAAFNRMNGSTRLRYFDEDGSHLDVFVDELRLCHVISWRRQLETGMRTLPMAELLLTKLQVVNAEPKDLSGLSALLTDGWPTILDDWARLGRLVKDDWGLWRTSRGTLEKLASPTDLSRPADAGLAAERAGELLGRWSALTLSLKAQVRGRIGERVRWYEEPEEV